MHEEILKKLEQKISDIVSDNKDLAQIGCFFSNSDDSKSFSLGVVIGRLYNSFYYQSKRILNREPNDEEFKEFMNLIKSKKSILENLW